ncbi:MAG: heavy metal translocating P-type ATPase [Rhodothermales bacterium]
MTETTLISPPVSARTVPCAHCGLPAPAVEGEPSFCCTGCEMVYRALHDAGLDETFYHLRDVQETASGRADETRLDELFLAEIDSPAFLAAHTRLDEAGLREGTFQLEGIHCAGCVWLVEQMPQIVPGVAEARLNLVRGRLRLRWNAERVSLPTVARWLARFGYRLQTVSAEAQGAPEAERRLLRRVGAAWSLAGNVMLLAVAEYAGLDIVREPQLATGARWLSFALTCVALVYGGRPFFSSAWESLRTSVRVRNLRNMHMDTPIALGVLIAFLHSAWTTIQGSAGDVWFDSISVLIAALLTARWLQFRSLRWAQETANRLLRLIPVMARKVIDGAERALVPCTALGAGDTIEVLAGEVVPVDGVVLDGISAIDNAALTGESRPLTIAPGAPVEAGAINRGADLLVRVDAAGGETRLGRLLDWVERSESDRAPVSYLVDRISAYFVLAVLGLTLITGWIWWSVDPSRAVFNMVALLVITCPCALAMATPLSLAVATGRAAGLGVFMKHESVFQTLHDADTLVFDKTGTLTAGALRVVDLEGDASVLGDAGALERGLTHPVARVLEAYASDDQADDRVLVPGKGVEGIVRGRRVRLGRPDWVFGAAEAPPSLRAAVDTYTRHGHVTVVVSVDARPVAVLALADAVRPDARRLVARLQAEGKTIHLLSGDHPSVVASIAERLGIAPERATGYATPEQKQTYIQRLRDAGHVVAMIGDGINDAAALRASSVGIAVAGTLSPGFSAADVYVAREGLAGLRHLFSATADVLRRIRITLWFSLAYNLAGALAAMAGVVHPLLAAIAMPVSSLIVALLASAPARAVRDETEE